VSNAWFESVAEAHRRAERMLPPSVYGALVAGSQQGLTLRDNIDSYNELGFIPHIADLPEERELSTTVMGQHISMPVLISPTGVQAVHPEGELAVARAAAAKGTAMGLSSFGSRPVEDVVEANPQTFFQTYWVGSREEIAERVRRAREAGAVGLIVTLDWTFSSGRDWGSPSIPERLDLKTMLRFAPEGAMHPRWLMRYLHARRLPNLTTPNVDADPSPSCAPTFFGAYGQWMETTPPTWDDIAWLREQWDGPFMVKGVMRIDDAKHAADIGATAISVSNHGGNNVDGTPASLRALPGIADAVGDRVEVLLDGGIRRGSDVVKALCLGARAVMIGRAYLWGLAASGQAGVENVLDILRNDIDSTLMGLRRRSVHDLGRDDILVPAAFGEAVSARTSGPIEAAK
jgi:heme/flavin dehydrogenase (mycofactocin system)